MGPSKTLYKMSMDIFRSLGQSKSKKIIADEDQNSNCSGIPCRPEP